MRRMNRTWLPILAGVLLGTLAWCVLAMLETPSFYRITVWVFGETSPKRLFGMPGYFCVHRAILLLMAGAGGGIGIVFSRWAHARSVLFLILTLAVIAIFAALGFH
jgi:hypothetical protein